MASRAFQRSFLSSISNSQPFSNKPLTVLGIETSCDDTGVAIVTTDRRILAESLYSQWSEHRRQGAPSLKHSQLTAFGGGVVPNLARQLHHDALPNAVSECVEKAFGLGNWHEIDALAVAVKPGLEPCLWEGIKFSKLLLRRHPHLVLVPIHHMQAHALTGRLFDSQVEFPFLTLLISGGHCLLALVRDYQTFEVFGQSLDVSPGNCTDKVARQLGLFELGPPNGSKTAMSGGALIEAYAAKGDAKKFAFIIEMIRNYCLRNKDCQFSFGGLLSCVHILVDKLTKEAANTRTITISRAERKVLHEPLIQDVCAVMQTAISYHLEDRVKRALIYLEIMKANVKHAVVSGGVASNKFIRSRLKGIIENEFNVTLSCPPIQYCTDNGVMIAWNGCEKLMSKSPEIINPNKECEKKLDDVKPLGKSELGEDRSWDIRSLKIKI